MEISRNQEVAVAHHDTDAGGGGTSEQHKTAASLIDLVMGESSSPFIEMSNAANIASGVGVAGAVVIDLTPESTIIEEKFRKSVALQVNRSFVRGSPRPTRTPSTLSSSGVLS